MGVWLWVGLGVCVWCQRLVEWAAETVSRLARCDSVLSATIGSVPSPGGLVAASTCRMASSAVASPCVSDAELDTPRSLNDGYQ